MSPPGQHSGSYPNVVSDTRPLQKRPPNVVMESSGNKDIDEEGPIEPHTGVRLGQILD